MSDLTIDAPRNARAAVVLVHGAEASKDWGFLPWLAEKLCDARFAVARFTMRGETYARQVGEVVDVIDRIDTDYRHLPRFLLGHSLGGAIALMAASEVSTLSGVITWSAMSQGEGIDVAESIARIDVPLLAVHGANDTTIPVDESRRIVSRVKDASLVVIDGATHTYNAIDPLVYVPRALEYAAAVSAAFIAAYA